MTRFVRDTSVPKGFAALVDVERCVAKYTALVSEHTSFDAVQSLIQLFEHELDVTKSGYEDVWNDRIEFVFLAAKLYIYASLAVNEGRDMASGDRAVRNRAPSDTYCTHLSQGLSAAVRITSILSSGCFSLQAHPSTSASPEILEHQLHLDGLPKFYFRALVFAAFYLLRYFALNGQCRPADRDLARNHVIMAYNYMQKHSADPMDECGRAAAVIDALSRGGSTSQQMEGMAALRVRERLGASIFYDALTVANELRNKPVRLRSTTDGPQQSPDDRARSTATESPTGTRASQSNESPGENQWDWTSFLTPGMMEGFDLNFDLEAFGLTGESYP
ncbi:hypothetical protein GQ53DRAFT_828881 [Thozetella sp. PMI_491]|nr:hypothetical protein GQ53DRAFT_828881 [Thozetella sp. PMI_491]